MKNIISQTNAAVTPLATMKTMIKNTRTYVTVNTSMHVVIIHAR